MHRPQIAVFNHLLAQQPALRADFAALAGRRVRVELTPFAVSGVVCEDGYWAKTSGEPEAVVRLGAGTALRRLSGSPLGPADVELVGDAELAAQLARLAGRLQWDAVEDLSRVMGDMAAARMAGAARGLLGFKGEIAIRLGRSLVEHWRDEVPLVARRHDVAGFCHQVDDARDAVERLDKRIERLLGAKPR